MKKNKRRDLFLWLLILTPYLLLIPAAIWYFKTLDDVEHSSFIIINKAEMTLYNYNYKGELLQKSLIATGKNFGNKGRKGDSRTPEGVFKISEIENASTWEHDFKDDSLGPISGAYGPYFIRLNVPGQKGIGIHGTHDNNSLGSRASEGCVRMHNEEIKQLVKNIKTAAVVVITPGVEDLKVNASKLDSTVSKPKTPIIRTKTKKLISKIDKMNSDNVKLILKDKNKK